MQWLAEPFRQTIPVFSNDQPGQQVSKPKAYLIPPAYGELITRLQAHGVVLDTLAAPTDLKVEMYRIAQHTFATSAFEGHIKVQGKPVAQQRQEHFPAGTVRVRTDQPLGDLAAYLLEPGAGSSFFQWGFVKEIFNRTEYVEAYVMQPYAADMLRRDPKLKAAFEEKRRNDPGFAQSPRAILAWFYEQTPFADDRYLLYPIAREL